MADEKKEDDVKDDRQTSSLMDQFDLDLATFEAQNYENEEGKCMHFIFTDKTSQHKFQIYHKTFTVADCVKLKKDAKCEHMPLQKCTGLLMHCLSRNNKSHPVQFNVEHGKYLQINILYSPDEWTSIKFALTIPAKEMNEIDLLKLRLKAAEDKIKELEGKPARLRWKKAVAQNPKATTDKTTHNVNNYLVSITLPQKAGRYLCQFSFWVHSSNTWVNYSFKKGNTQFVGDSSGCNTPAFKAASSHFSVSNMGIVDLNGNENEENRTIRLYATGHGTHQATFTNCVLVCEELDD